MDLRTKLDVIYSDGGVETDLSSEAQDFRRDSFQLQLTTDDFIYVGYKKPFNALYAQLEVANTISSSLTLEYYTDSGWATLELSDDTKAFARSGFMNWDRNQLFEDTVQGYVAWSAVAVAGKEQFWVRFSSNDDIDQITLQGLNLVFSDDNDIAQEVPALVDSCFYPAGQTSHILGHVAAKNNIMSRLKTVGYVNYNTDNREINITEWDVLDIYEMRQASTYYTISQIYFNLSDDPEDQYWAKYREYDKKFEEAFGLGRLRIDQDDDGQVDGSEKRPIKSVRWVR